MGDFLLMIFNWLQTQIGVIYATLGSVGVAFAITLIVGGTIVLTFFRRARGGVRVSYNRIKAWFRHRYHDVRDFIEDVPVRFRNWRVTRQHKKQAKSSTRSTKPKRQSMKEKFRGWLEQRALRKQARKSARAAKRFARVRPKYIRPKFSKRLAGAISRDWKRTKEDFTRMWNFLTSPFRKTWSKIQTWRENRRARRNSWQSAMERANRRDQRKQKWARRKQAFNDWRRDVLLPWLNRQRQKLNRSRRAKSILGVTALIILFYDLSLLSGTQPINALVALGIIIILLLGVLAAVSYFSRRGNRVQDNQPGAQTAPGWWRRNGKAIIGTLVGIIIVNIFLRFLMGSMWYWWLLSSKYYILFLAGIFAIILLIALFGRAGKVFAVPVGVLTLIALILIFASNEPTGPTAGAPKVPVIEAGATLKKFEGNPRDQFCTGPERELVLGMPAEDSLLVEIISAESGCRHWSDTLKTQVLANRTNSDGIADLGLAQIHDTPEHRRQADSLEKAFADSTGATIRFNYWESARGNLNFARWIFQQEGSRPWVSSSCIWHYHYMDRNCPERVGGATIAKVPSQWEFRDSILPVPPQGSGKWSEWVEVGPAGYTIDWTTLEGAVIDHQDQSGRITRFYPDRPGNVSGLLTRIRWRAVGADGATIKMSRCKTGHCPSSTV